MQVIEVVPVGFRCLRRKNPAEGLVSQHSVGVRMTGSEEHLCRFVPEGLSDSPCLGEGGIGVDEEILVGEIKHWRFRFRSCDKCPKVCLRAATTSAARAERFIPSVTAASIQIFSLGSVPLGRTMTREPPSIVNRMRSVGGKFWNPFAKCVHGSNVTDHRASPAATHETLRKWRGCPPDWRPEPKFVSTRMRRIGRRIRRGDRRWSARVPEVHPPSTRNRSPQRFRLYHEPCRGQRGTRALPRNRK